MDADLANLEGQQLVIGGGVSGYGAAAFLRARGFGVRVSEGKTLTAPARERFLQLGAEVLDGGHAPKHLDGVTRVVLSPGLAMTHPLVSAAVARGLPLVSEIDLALAAFGGVLIAVTGTNGKTTTCAMLGHILNKAGVLATVGGNYGDPPTQILAEGRMGDFLVLELSSYQLEQSRLVAPRVGIFTSFSHDHLARHGSLAAYFAAKWSMFSQLPKGGLALMTTAVAEQAAAAGLRLEPSQVTVEADTSALQALAPPNITAAHDRLNAGFSLRAAAHVLGRKEHELVSYLEDFRGLPHRCEVIGQSRGAPVTNDSKSTNVESTLVALAAQKSPVLLLMGGQGKDEPYTPLLAAAARDKIAHLVCFGASGGAIARTVETQLSVQEFPTLKDALAAIGGIMDKHPGGVLFSPGCASFDEFRNYEERGECFRAAMQPWLS